MPATLAKTEQKLQMLGSGELFCYLALQRGSFFISPHYNFYVDAPGTEHFWEEFRSTQYVYECYEHWHRRENTRQRKIDQSRFAKKCSLNTGIKNDQAETKKSAYRGPRRVGLQDIGLGLEYRPSEL